MTATLPPTTRPPHPVFFGVEYDEHQDRWKTLLRLFLAIPQLIVVYILQTVFSLLSFFAWFAILFTGRYPRGLFDLSVGILRWSANVVAYVALLRDEYPPFSLDPGRYPVVLDIPYPEHQSRARLFVRFITIIPQYIVFSFVQIAWAFVTMLAWFSLLVGAKYPQRFFGFSVGTMRWYLRQQSYLYLLRDEYPPYRFSNTAPPDSELASGIVGAPLLAVYIAVIVLFSAPGLFGGDDTVNVRVPLTSPSLATNAPHGSANGLEVSLIDYEDDAPVPVDADRVFPFSRFVGFRVRVQKDGLLPTFFTPGFFKLRDCDGLEYSVEDTSADFWFHLFIRDDRAEGWVYFQVYEDSQPCDLTYRSIRQIQFIFWSGI